MDFAHLAQLSKLCFTDEEQKQLKREMREIITLMDEIQNAPGAQAPQSLCTVYGDLRNDAAVRVFNDQQKKSAYSVPKVVE